MQLDLESTVSIASFNWKWPEGNPEHFSQACDIVVQIDGAAIGFATASPCAPPTAVTAFAQSPSW